MWGGGPPVLRTMHSQFTELRPLNEVPALTLERIDRKCISRQGRAGELLSDLVSALPARAAVA
jgi:hypothetical protein